MTLNRNPDESHSVEQADAFFRARLHRYAPDDWQELWWVFDHYREGWRRRQDEDGFIGHSLDHFVDHGWAHWEAVYALMPSLLVALEHSGESTAEILGNAGEYLALMFASYLHDIGQVCPAQLQQEFVEDVVRSPEMHPNLPPDVKDVFRVRGKTVQKRNDQARPWLSLKELRQLHAQLGAWRIRKGKGAPFSEPDIQEAVARVVEKHRKGTEKSLTENCRLAVPAVVGGPGLTVRVGVLASLIAIADECTTGYRRVSQAKRTIEEVVAEWQMDYASRRGESVTDRVRDLAAQKAHYLRHGLVDRIVLTGNAAYVVPRVGVSRLEDWLGEELVWDEPQFDQRSGRLKYQERRPTRRELLNEAVTSLREEMDGAADSKVNSVRDILRQEAGRDVLPRRDRIRIAETGRLLAQCEKAGAQLQAWIAAEVAADPALAQYRPAMADGFIAHHTAVFEGRRRELEDLAAFAGGRDDGKCVAVVWGEPGVGKSALLSNLARQLHQNRLITHWIQAGGASADPVVMLKWLCRQAQEHLGRPGRTEKLPDTVGELSDNFIWLLRRAADPNGPNLIVIIDGVDELAHVGNEGEPPDWLPQARAVPPGVRIIYGVRPKRLADHLCPPTDSHGLSMKLDPLGETDGQALVARLWPEADSSSRRALATASEGNPLHLRFAVSEVYRSGDPDWDSDKFRGLPGLLSRAIERAAKRVNGQVSLVHDLLGLLAVVRTDLTRRELGELWPISGDRGWKANLPALLQELEGEFLWCDENVVRFGHQHFQELAVQALGGEDELRQYHSALADMLLRKSPADGRARNDVLYHLQACGRADDQGACIDGALEYARSAAGPEVAEILRSMYCADPRIALLPVARYAVVCRSSFLAQRVATDLLGQVDQLTAVAAVRGTLHFAAETAATVTASEFGFRWRELLGMRGEYVGAIRAHIESLLTVPQSPAVLAQCMNLWYGLGVSGPDHVLRLVTQLAHHGFSPHENVLTVIVRSADVHEMEEWLQTEALTLPVALRGTAALSCYCAKAPWQAYPFALALPDEEHDPDTLCTAMRNLTSISGMFLCEWGLPSYRRRMLDLIEQPQQDPCVRELAWRRLKAMSRLDEYPDIPERPRPSEQSVTAVLPEALRSALDAVLLSDDIELALQRWADQIGAARGEAVSARQWTAAGMVWDADRLERLLAVLEIYSRKLIAVPGQRGVGALITQAIRFGCSSEAVVSSFAQKLLDGSIPETLRNYLVNSASIFVEQSPPELKKALVADMEDHWSPPCRWDAFAAHSWLWPTEAIERLRHFLNGAGSEDPDSLPYVMMRAAVAQMITGQREEYVSLFTDVMTQELPPETIRRLLEIARLMWLVEVRDRVLPLQQDGRLTQGGLVRDLAGRTLECLDSRPHLRPSLEIHLQSKGFL